MFWSDFESTSRIERANVDGSERVLIVENVTSGIYGLALDYGSERLYWCGVFTLEYVRFDGRLVDSSAWWSFIKYFRMCFLCVSREHGPIAHQMETLIMKYEHSEGATLFRNWLPFQEAAMNLLEYLYWHFKCSSSN